MTAPLQPFSEFNSDLLNEVRAALRKSGWLLPTTDEEIDQALCATEVTEEDVDAALTDPRELFRSGESESSDHEPPATPSTEHSQFQEDVEESLAVAAREGKEIPPEIREKMDRDRKEAEQDQESPEDSATEKSSSEKKTEEGQ
jgi:hypothetical protein